MKNSSGNVGNFFPAYFTALSPRKLGFSHTMKLKTESISRRLQDIVSQKDDLGLLDSGVQEKEAKMWQKRESTSLVCEPHVYGRDEEKNKIIDLLLGEGENCSDFCVIPIIGKGGIGKTTLTQLVFNDERVKKNFDIRAWVCISIEFDVLRISTAIMNSITSANTSYNTLNQAQVALHDALMDKKFLMVLDDVWSENYEDWNSLRIPLRAGAKGSRIIVTTRSRVSASIMGTTSNHLYLEPLSDGDCWLLFQQHAFDGVDVITDPNLVILGKKVSEKCKGLPLAAKALGGLLRSKVELDEWEEILHNDIWKLQDAESDILPMLRLSYSYLPPQLKRCFAYCSILPKDYEFEEKEIILLWMADGLLIQHESKKQMEDLGHGYFHVLVSRSFFEKSKLNDSRFRMHDLVNDLAQWAAGDVCLRLDDLEKTLTCGVPKRTRHFSFIRSKHETMERFEALNDIFKLRTFLSFGLNYCGLSFLARAVDFDLIPKFDFVRVLTLSWCYIMKLPDTIADLKHLRYLDVSGTKLRELPETIGKLFNLQTLLLIECQHLEKLPTSIRNLVNLRHLDIVGTTSLSKMPVGIGNLVNLRTLSRFVVDNEDGGGIGEFKSLRCLQGTLSISGLENVVRIEDALESRLDDKLDLSGLHMEWSSNFDLRDGDFEKKLLSVLCPPKKLEEYKLKCYGGAKFPSWLEEPSFTNMVTLTMKDCRNCQFLPSLGKLPSLKRLHIEGITRVKSVGVEFYGKDCSKPFPSLVTLCFQFLEEWEEWITLGVDKSFPNLEELSIINCPRLHKQLPVNLPSLKRLEISKCMQLVVSPLCFPVLHEMKVRECKTFMQDPATVDMGHLKTLELFHISELYCLKEDFLIELTELETLHIEDCRELASLWCCRKTLLKGLPALHNLVIANCPKLLFLPCELLREQQKQRLHGKLEHLTLQGCDKLEIFPQDLGSLRVLTITNCSKLIPLLGNILPSNIRKLNIRFCNSLESVTEWLSSCSSLESLSISSCPALLSVDRIPHTLQSMEIYNCEKLQLVADEKALAPTVSSSPVLNMPMPSSLESLRIGGCPTLTSLLGNGSLPITLKTLDVFECQNLENLPIEKMGNPSFLENLKVSRCEKLRVFKGGLHNLIFLTTLEISSCINLVQFADGGLLSSGLKELNIHDCRNLEALPNHLDNLTSLQELKIGLCPKILFFPEGGLPPNLTLLWIRHVKIKDPISNWGLCRIITLKELWLVSVGCLESVESFPEETMDLPSSLNFLKIGELYSIKNLSIGDFSNLAFLTIQNCPKVTLFPDTDLPQSLVQFHIFQCSCLKQQLLVDKARVWPILSRIPCVVMDNMLYSPSKNVEGD